MRPRSDDLYKRAAMNERYTSVSDGKLISPTAGNRTPSTVCFFCLAISLAFNVFVLLRLSRCRVDTTGDTAVNDDLRLPGRFGVRLLRRSFFNAISVIFRMLFMVLCLRQERCSVLAATSSFLRCMVEESMMWWTRVGNASWYFSSI